MVPEDELPREHLFDELKRYVRFSDEDGQALHQVKPLVVPFFGSIVDEFYARTQQHEGAAAVFTDRAQVDRLKGTLSVWLQELLTGPWDLAYYERRARIGRMHVKVGLPQHYMFGAMSLIRRHIVRVAMDSDRPDANRIVQAVDRIIDLELAIMLHTYREAIVEKMRRSERLAAYGQVAASIAHELRNPLGVMDSSLYLLRRRVVGDDDAERHIDRLRDQVERSNGIITDLLDLVRDQPPQPRPVAMAVLLNEALKTIPDSGVARVRPKIPDDAPPLHVDPAHVTRVLANLLQNAFDATDSSGEIEVTVHVDGDYAVLLVNDSGPGIDPDVGLRIFEPLVTTKAQGIGLGLALCVRLVRENGGELRLGKGRLPGAAFEVRLPLAEP